MSYTAHKQTTTHPHSHDGGGVSEGGRNVIPSNLQMTLDKCYVNESDHRDLGSDTSGPISSRTKRKSKLHGSANQAPGGKGYDESDSAETGVPSDHEVDDTTKRRHPAMLLCPPRGDEWRAARHNGGVADTRLGANIHDTKLHYSQNFGYIFAYLIPRNDAWQWFYHHTADYLSRVSYLITA